MSEVQLGVGGEGLRCMLGGVTGACSAWSTERGKGTYHVERCCSVVNTTVARWNDSKDLQGRKQVTWLLLLNSESSIGPAIPGACPTIKQY